MQPDSVCEGTGQGDCLLMIGRLCVIWLTPSMEEVENGATPYRPFWVYRREVRALLHLAPNNSASTGVLGMKNSRQDGLYLLTLGVTIFVLFGASLRLITTSSMADFNGVYYGTECLLQHNDIYNESEFRRHSPTDLTKAPLDSVQPCRVTPLSINLPPTFLFMVPLALLPVGLASVVWMVLTATGMILAAFLMWNLGAAYAPTLTGGLVGFLLANSAVVVANGNIAGIVVSLCVIAVWCFLKERFVLAGVLCLAISLAMKPHDAALVWLFFLLANGVYRKRALQTLAVTVMLGLAAGFWVSQVAPNWMPEMRANLAAASAPGNNNDPGPAGPTSTRRSILIITDLQAAVSVFRDDPNFYNLISYAVCGVCLLVWSIATFRSSSSTASACFALAAAAPLTMLATYHRVYDAKLLLLAVPACAILWAEGGPIAKVALLVTATGLVSTGEIPLGIFFQLTKDLHPSGAGLFGKIETVALTRPAPIMLLAMSVFYLWVYVRRTRGKSMAPEYLSSSK